MKNKLKATLLTVSLLTAGIVAASVGIGNASAIHAGDIACAHEGNHYIRKEATSASSGVKEYAVCCKCHEVFVAESDEFIVSPGYATDTLIQFKILNGLVAGKNFLASDDGYSIQYGSGSAQAGWFGADNDGTYGYITAHFNSAVTSGTTFSMLKGSYITGTDSNVYKLAADVSVTYNGSSWDANAKWTPTGVSGEANSSTDSRYIPQPATAITLSKGWASGQNVQMTPSASISGGTDGDRLTISNKADYVQTNVSDFSGTFRVWNETVIGLDPTSLPTSPTAGTFFIFKSGMKLVDKNEAVYELSADLAITYDGTDWATYDTTTDGVVTGVSAGGVNGTTNYFYPQGTNLKTYNSGDAQTGGIVGSQCSYAGSIKFCGVEFNALNNFSDSLHLFATINGANWNGTTLSVKIYDSDTWVSQGYSSISDFSAYDFGVSTITLDIASGTVLKLTEGSGGNYLFVNDVSMVYNGTAWVVA